ncbi:MAG: hypothetical protein M0T71_05940 [Actinomycetota bacterium]|jgi:hypothetical protein|nr:hypothetical protein [Actinomycetota bacterium]
MTEEPAGAAACQLARVAEALREHARGMYCTEAAVELLIGHRRWLERGDFVSCFVGVLDDEPGGPPMAMLDWSGALEALQQGELTCSSSEGQVLALAASLAAGIAVDLQDALCGLDLANTMLLATAVVHATGHRRSVFESSGSRDVASSTP